MVPQAQSSFSLRLAGALFFVLIVADSCHASNCSCTSAWTMLYDIRGISVGPPAITSYSPDTINVFVRGTDGQMWGRFYENEKWLAWKAHGGQLTSSPSASSPGSKWIFLAVRGSDNQYWARSYDTEKWMSWEPIGGEGPSDPAVVALSTDHFVVFVCSENGTMHYRSKRSNTWDEWKSLNQSCTSSPAAVHVGDTFIGIAFINGQGSLSLGTGYVENLSWTYLPILMQSKAALGSRGAGILTVVTRDEVGMLSIISFDVYRRQIVSMNSVSDGLSGAVATAWTENHFLLAARANGGETIISTFTPDNDLA